MKKILKFTAVALLGFMASSCSNDEFPTYEGASQLQFNDATAGKGSVEIGQISNDASISYGTFSPVTENHQVKLVFDATGSTAVPGVDFELVNAGVDILNAGEAISEFKVRILESGATTTPKIANFHLESATLPKASVRQNYTLTMSLKCSINFMLGATGIFDYTGYWGENPQYIVKKGATPNTLEVEDFFDIGLPLILKYDNDGGLTFDEQDTGSIYSPGGVPSGKPIKVRVPQAGSAGPTEPSTYDACGKKFTVNMNYFVPGVGSFGNKAEIFTR